MTAIRFEVLPVFSKLCFADNTDVKEPLDYVLQIRKKEDPDNTILNILKKVSLGYTGSSTVGDLRKFSDNDWLKVDIPAVCRIYLKHAVRQAERRPNTGSPSEDRAWTLLENDFNGGQPFDLAPYQKALDSLVDMSFTRVEAMEALLITGTTSTEAALEVLVKTPADKAARRAAAIKAGTPRGGGAREAALNEQLIAAQRQFEREKAQRMQVEVELKHHKGNVPKEAYKGYLRGLISTEMISVTDQEKLKKYREELRFTDKDHQEALSEIGMSLEEFEKLKTDEQRREKECVVCLDKPRTHVIFDCMHLCLCGDCTEQNKKCPICTKKIVQVRRVFF
jgi:hypothetical protein